MKLHNYYTYIYKENTKEESDINIQGKNEDKIQGKGLERYVTKDAPMGIR
jgi:hypothetical protein